MWRCLQVILTIIMVLASMAGKSLGDIYRYVNEDGSVTFSDFPKGPGYELFIETREAEEEKGKGNQWEQRRKWLIGYAEKISLVKGVDPNLVKAIIKVESGFKHRALSGKGARGVMQLLPSSFPDNDANELFDPIRNIEIGVEHFKKLLDRFNGNVSVALAAYNAGIGAVLKYGGIPPFSETEQYVENVLSAYRKYKESGWQK